MIGKVSLSHQQISAQPRGEPGGSGIFLGGPKGVVPMLLVPTPSPSAGIDGWLSLAPVDPDEEVQGEIQLEVQVPEQGHPRVLRCHLIRAR